MSETATRALVVVVIVGAVIVVAGWALFAFLLVQRHSAAVADPVVRPAAAAPVLAAGALPSGARATALTLAGDRIAILYDRPGGSQGAVVVGPDGVALLRVDPLAR